MEKMKMKNDNANYGEQCEGQNERTTWKWKIMRYESSQWELKKNSRPSRTIM